MQGALVAGQSVGIGSLPHRCARAAAELSLHALDLPTVPAAPRRDPAEGMIAQAVVGLRGFTLGPYGSIAVDVARIDPQAPILTDLNGPALGAMREFLRQAEGRQGPVKWQFVGPVTLGIALMRAGVPIGLAFEQAVAAVRAHVANLHAAVEAALPGCPQVVFLDEPSLGELMQPGFPLAPDRAIDLLSGALAAIEPRAVAGVHCCGHADWASLIAAGPTVLSLPATPRLEEIAGYLSQFLERGGWIAWGVIPTDGPMPLSADRPWRHLSELWCQLVRRGCDPVRLRLQSLVSPACGLALHAPEVATRIYRLTTDVARRVQDQAAATRFNIGA